MILRAQLGEGRGKVDGGGGPGGVEAHQPGDLEKESKCKASGKNTSLILLLYPWISLQLLIESFCPEVGDILGPLVGRFRK